MPASAKDILPELGRRPLVMGILNVTPDSFSDGGAFQELATAVAQGQNLAREGADIIDIGGESTRPGHHPVPAAEEQARVLPVIRALAALITTPISIDTYKAQTARLALDAGARIVNDVWGLQREPEIARVAADHGAPAVVMHNRTEIDDSLDVIDELRRFFAVSLEIADKAGLDRGQIILDPGIGFGKSRRQNIEALRRLDELRSLGLPVLVGASRKSLIGHLTGRPTDERLPGTLAAHLLAASRGADILRVHDVAAHVDALRVAAALQGGPP